MTTHRKGRARTAGPGDDDGTRPEPVLTAAIAPMAAAAVGLLVAFGVRMTDAQQSAVLTAATTLAAVVALAANWWARRLVTPVEDPRDDQGRDLIPAP